ncbi:MAG: PAS domain S-box protein [Candidatus Hydrogenedentes bacterium]|nr:PAS domain S-box protein [Candidatus Hydrogenedentota bacterium]
MNEATRVAIPVIIERMGLAIRYFLYILLLSLVGLGYAKGNAADIAIISIILLVHHGFIHTVLWKKRYDLLFTRANFLINFFEVSVIVVLTGADTTAGYLLYFAFIVAFSAYDRRYWRVLFVSSLCAASYTLAVLWEAWRAGLAEEPGILIVKIVYIFVIGWLVAVLSERLRVAEEVSSRQTAQLASSEATLRTILNSAGDPIIVFDENEFITETNQRAAEFLMVPHEQLVGRRVRAFLFDDGTLANKFAHLRVRGEGQSEEVFVNAEGEERSAEMVVRSYNRDNTCYFVAIVRDVTNRKELQEATRLANIQLERLNSELRQVERLKTNFLASISRNMRSPLSAVAGYVEMMLDEELGEVNAEQRKALQTCRRGLLRVFRLIEEALDLHRLETKRSQIAAAQEGARKRDHTNQ